MKKIFLCLSILNIYLLLPLHQTPAKAQVKVLNGFTFEVYAESVHMPSALSFDSQGNLYVGHDEVRPSQIYKILPGGEVVIPFGPEVSDPDCVAVNSSDYIFVGSEQGLYTVSPKGDAELFTTEFMGNNTAITIESSGLFGEIGDIFVANARSNYDIVKLKPDRTASILVTGSVLHIPFGLAFDDVGNLYAAEWESENGENGLYKITQNGEVSNFVNLNGPHSLVFNKEERILYVGDAVDNKIYKVTLSGVVSIFAENVSPYGLAFGFNGDLYVSDQSVSPGRILKFNTGPAPTINLSYTPVTPCRIVDTRKSGGIIGASTQRDFRVYGSGGAIGAQGGNPSGCPSPLGEPRAAHINMVAVDPTGKGNLQAFPVGAGTGAGLSVNYNTIDTNLANAGTVKAITGAGPDITVASNFSSAHTVIDVLGYYYPDEGFYYTPVDPCRIVDTRKTSAGIIGASTQLDFRVSGPVGDQGGDPAGCPSTLGVSPEAAHLNMIAVDPTGKGNLQAFPMGAGTGAGLSVNYNTIDTNLANAGTVKTSPDITVASNFSSAHTVIDVLGYYSEEEDLLYTPVIPCRIVDTRKTPAGIIDANTERDFRVFGPVSVQGGNTAGCSAPMGEPLAAHINMVAVNPTGKGNLQAFPVGAGTGAGLSVNYNTIDTNLANAGTIKTVTGSGADITVASNFSSAHTVIDVLGYYYPAP